MSDPVSPDELAALRLAFKKGLLDDLARADQELAPEEIALAEQLAPRAELERHGLVAGAALTPRFHRLQQEALHRLAGLLSLEERLGLVTEFLEMCVVDGHLHRDEGSLLWEAASLLGIDTATFDAHLDSLEHHVGGVDLGDPE